MLKYDSYGWFDRPSEKDFASMLGREKEWKELEELKQQQGSVAANATVTVSNAAYKGERSRSGDDSGDELEI